VCRAGTSDILCDGGAEGNVEDVTERLMRKIGSHDHRQSYLYDDHIFHYQVSDGLVYLCLADREYPRHVAFDFLSQLQSRFNARYGKKARTARAREYNRDFRGSIDFLMQEFNENDKLTQVKRQVDDIKSVMMENIDRVLERGEKLEIMVEKSEKLEEHAKIFQKRGTDLKRHFCVQNAKWMVLLAIVVIVIVFIIVLVACGGFTFDKCK
jgi:vesicle-associated membrane protein 7